MQNDEYKWLAIDEDGWIRRWRDKPTLYRINGFPSYYGMRVPTHVRDMFIWSETCAPFMKPLQLWERVAPASFSVPQGHMQWEEWWWKCIDDHNITCENCNNGEACEHLRYYKDTLSNVTLYCQEKDSVTLQKNPFYKMSGCAYREEK